MSSETRPNDILFQILGPDRHERIRGLECGATSFNTFGYLSSRSTQQSQQEETNFRQAIISLESQLKTTQRENQEHIEATHRENQKHFYILFTMMQQPSSTITYVSNKV